MLDQEPWDGDLVKARQPAVVVILVLMLLVGLLTAAATFAHWSYRYSPGLGHESVLLREYNPRLVIESLAVEDNPIRLSGQVGSGAGRNFVTNERKINPMFAIRTDMRPQLMAALNEDVIVQLVRHGGTILSRSGDPQAGFRLTYRDGTSVGTVTLLPFADDNQSNQGGALPEGTRAVRAEVVISEKWFPDKTTAIRASVEPR
jgi:hypothetical protein